MENGIERTDPQNELVDDLAHIALRTIVVYINLTFSAVYLH